MIWTEVMKQETNNINSKNNKLKKHVVTSCEKVNLDKLKEFMSSFNPYVPITNKDLKYLHSLKIYETNDPFQVTNQLISLVENLIEVEQKDKKIE